MGQGPEPAPTSGAKRRRHKGPEVQQATGSADLGKADLASDVQLPPEIASALLPLFRGLDRRKAVVIPAEQGTHNDDSLNSFSIFASALGIAKGVVPPAVDEAASKRQWDFVTAAAEADAGVGAAVASLVGLNLGDALGLPLEFTAVNGFKPNSGGKSVVPMFSEDRPHLKAELAGTPPALVYSSEYNKFKLKRGQWTDDSSMALSMADSLLVHNGYAGGDARARWHMWWTHGYCNAFRFDAERGRSVGLGGNISLSLRELEALPNRDPDHIPPVFGSSNEDAGNGSIMRLAPVPIAFCRDPTSAEQVARLQSRATHPGPDASACCSFMTFLICQALAAHRRGEQPGSDVQNFLATQIDAYLASHPASDSGMENLHALLRSDPPSPKEANWDWKLETPRIELAIHVRKGSFDGTYNGYPVLPTYFGAYCMDGLAMALWALWHSRTFDEAALLVVNLGGDADTTGAIACQMAGAIYGMAGIKAGPVGAKALENLRRWDPYCEVGLRALLLYAIPAQPLDLD